MLSEQRTRWWPAGVSDPLQDMLAGTWGKRIGDALLEATVRQAAKALGRLGGKVKSERKAAASRENGKKGGRPPKEPAQKA